MVQPSLKAEAEEVVVLAAEPGAELAQEPVVAQEPVAPVREAERLAAARADPAHLPGQAAARAALAAAG